MKSGESLLGGLSKGIKMAFGIDDALTIATGAISLGDTLVETIKKYKHEKKDYDLELLIEEVRITALRRIKDADNALDQFADMLKRRKIDSSKSIQEVIDETPFWKPFEQFRLGQIRRNFGEFQRNIAAATDDIASLVRCRDQVGNMGAAVSRTVKSKRLFRERVSNANSLDEAIGLLRQELDRQRIALGG